MIEVKFKESRAMKNIKKSLPDFIRNKVIDIKQRTNKWFDLRSNKIGSSEIFALIQYYATDNELLSCGIQPKDFREESSFDTAFGLYHKIKKTKEYFTKPLSRAFADYGSAMETYAKQWLKNRYKIDIEDGFVFVDNDSIASTDVIGVWKDTTIQDYNGNYIDVVDNPCFIVEIKTINNFKYQTKTLITGIDWRTIIQYQYQLYISGLEWGGILAMILENDTIEERCYIAGLSQASKSKFIKYLEPKVKTEIYFMQKIPAFRGLFSVVLERFFSDIKNSNEPSMYPDKEESKAIFNMIRNYQDTFRENYVIDGNLSNFIEAKTNFDKAKENFENQKNIMINALYMSKSLKIIDNKNLKKIEIDGRNALILKDIKDFNKENNDKICKELV